MPTATTDSDFDVIVVGFGAAGACAAIAAAEHGARVLVVDRALGGGASAVSGGVVYAGGGTPYQVAAGYDDDADNMFDYLRQEVQGVVDDATLRRFCEHSANQLAWLEAHGAKFESSLCPYKTSYPTKHYLYFSGNEKAYPYKLHARPAPRGHRQIATGTKSGRDLWRCLRDSALAPWCYVPAANPGGRAGGRRRTSARNPLSDMVRWRSPCAGAVWAHDGSRGKTHQLDAADRPSHHRPGRQDVATTRATADLHRDECHSRGRWIRVQPRHASALCTCVPTDPPARHAGGRRCGHRAGSLRGRRHGRTRPRHRLAPADSTVRPDRGDHRRSQRRPDSQRGSLWSNTFRCHDPQVRRQRLSDRGFGYLEPGTGSSAWTRPSRF